MSVKNIDKKPFISKKMQKRMAGCCRICKEKDYNLLDVHRICEGGVYSCSNTVSLCCRCHRLQQAGKIKIDGWFHSTAGRMLRWRDEQGEERFS